MSWLKWNPRPIGTPSRNALAPSVANMTPSVTQRRRPGVWRGRKRIAIAPAIGSPISHERSVVGS